MSIQSEDTQGLEGAISTAPTKRRGQTGIVRVNLVPAEIAEARALRITAGVMAGAAVVTLGLVGFLYHQQTSAVDTAQAQLAAAQTQNAQLMQEQNRLGSVDALYAKVDAAQAMLASAEAPQVLWSRYLEDLRLQLPEHTWLTNIAATESNSGVGAAVTPAATTPAAATPATGTATTATTGTAAAGTGVHPSAGAAAPATTATAIGTLTFSGSSYTHNDVADWLDRLAGLHGVTGPYLSSSTQVMVGTGASAIPTVNWSLTASLNSAALKSSYTSANGAVTP